ncbi:MAG: TonB-dependent receptor [Sphingobacteriales bacterium]|nr:MAG: TonB-dependent receptor [Sphingobacteriales bacterium]
MKQLFTRSAILSFILVACALISNAHTGSVKGIVKGADNKPVDGANIFIKELKVSAVTDVFGAYFLKGIPEGKYAITISHVGFEPYEDNIKIEDGITTDIVTNLNPAGVNLSGVTINAQKELLHSSVSGVDLKLRPINTTQDILRMVPGLFISQHQGGGKAEQIFLRGFDIDHGTDVNVSVDGMAVNMVSHAHGQGYADLHFVLPELVDKMSFGKGPYQIDKGNLATAGWVEFKTKEYLDNSFVKVEGGNFGYARTAAGINILDKKSGNQTAYIAGEYVYNRGYFDAPQDFNRMNLTGKYTAHIGDNKVFSATLSGFRSNWDASGQVPERAVAEGLISRFGEIQKEDGKTSRYNLNLQYQQAINTHSFFKSNLYASYYDFELYSNFTFYLNDSINGDRIRQKEKRVLTGYNADYVNNYKIGKMNAKTQVGAGFRFDNVMDVELSNVLGDATTLRQRALGDIYETNMFGYVNETINLLPQLVLSAGTRFDYFIHTYNNKIAAEAGQKTFNANTFSPKAGLYYNFNDNARIYFNYGTGFHSNDTRVVVAQQANTILPRANSFDLGAGVKPFKKLLLSAALWRLDLQQEFVYVGDEAVVEPSGRTRRMGIDFSARYELLKWLYLDGDANYTHGRAIEEAKGEDYIPLAPVFTSIGGLTAIFKNGFSSSLRYRYMGDRPANEDNSVVAKGYTVCDLSVNYSRKRFDLGLQIQNLFNTTWNEAQFDTETRLQYESQPVSEICFTPGTPFFIKLIAAYKF